MKTIITILAMAAAITVSAADNKSASWLSSVTVAPVGAIKTADITGASQWGAGLDLGANVNPFVSLHVVNLSFEGPGQSSLYDKKTKENISAGQDAWGGRLVDETDLLVKAKIARFSTESFSVYAIGGGLRD